MGVRIDWSVTLSCITVYVVRSISTLSNVPPGKKIPVGIAVQPDCTNRFLPPCTAIATLSIQLLNDTVPSDDDTQEDLIDDAAVTYYFF